MRRHKALSRRYGRAAHGKIDSITVVGRRWFNRGNTYHSVEIIVNGRAVHRIPFAYGYDRAYEQSAAEWLIENGYIDGSAHTPLRRLAEDQGFKFESSATDVSRKKDL